MNKHMYSTANLTDQELKDQGNRMFSQRKYEDAANCYSKAIVSFFCIVTLIKGMTFSICYINILLILSM